MSSSAAAAKASHASASHHATPADLARYEASYKEVFGEVSTNFETRWDVATKHGRQGVAALVEELRGQAIQENPLGLKVQQLVHFGQLLVIGRKPGAVSHAKAALRAGATPLDLLGVAETALITGGVPAYSLGIEVINELS